MIAIIILIITIIYNLFAIVKNTSIPESISSTSYILGNQYYLFTFYCFAVGLLLLPAWLSFSIEGLTWLVFLSCSGILFAGATPFFKEDFQKPIHYCSGILTVVTFVLWAIFSGLYWFIFWDFIIILVLSLMDRRNFVYYTEIVGLLSLLILLI